MMSRISERLVWHLLVIFLVLGCVDAIAAQGQSRGKRRHVSVKAEKAPSVASTSPAAAEGEIIGKRIKFSDGSSLEADEVWKQGEEFWSRTGGMTRRIDRPIKIDPIRAAPKKELAKFVVPADSAVNKPVAAEAFWIFLK